MANMFTGSSKTKDSTKIKTNNLFGLRDEADNEDFNNLNQLEAKQILEMSNMLRFFCGLKKDIKASKDEVMNIISSSAQNFSYLNNASGRSLLSVKILENFYGSNAETKVAAVKADNNLLMVFRFYDLLVHSQKKILEVVSSSEKIPSWWSAKTVEFDDAERYQVSQIIDSLVDNLTICLRSAFESLTMGPEQFLERYEDHKFWSSSLTEKAAIIKKLS